MSPALDESDELWMRLVWLTRLRWTIGPALVAIPKLLELWTGAAFEMLPILALLGIALALNTCYSALLRRWGKNTARHVRSLEQLAHVQIIGDLAIEGASLHFTGGTASPFWPFFSMTVLAAALCFPRRGIIAMYATMATAMFCAIGLVNGGARSPNLLLLPMLLTIISIIAIYYSGRVNAAHRSSLELERLRTEKAAVEEVARRKDEILSKVSHELRNPLAALRGWVDLARKRRHGSIVAGQTMEQVLGRIDAQVSRMTRMVGDLYDLSSARAGQLQLETRPCDLVVVIKELVDRFSGMYPDLRCRVDAPQSMWGMWDPSRIDQLVTNLVGNAVKYAANSPITLRITPSSGQSAHLEVSDEGPGIPPDKLPGIFEAFTRATVERASGLGLGLSIAREIVLLHGGAIWVDSQVGRGTTFHVRLPTGGVRPPS
jgi:signal transduction histidine kinase